MSAHKKNKHRRNHNKANNKVNRNNNQPRYNPNGKKLYNEINEFLTLLGDKYINLLPAELYKFIVNNQLPNTKINIDFSQELGGQISDEALSFIAYLNMKYWCSSEEKNRLAKMYSMNDSDDLSNDPFFERIKNNPNFARDYEKENKALIVYENKNVFQKFASKVKNIFKSIFGI